jgi:hypothetical protein
MFATCAFHPSSVRHIVEWGMSGSSNRQPRMVVWPGSGQQRQCLAWAWPAMAPSSGRLAWARRFGGTAVVAEHAHGAAAGVSGAAPRGMSATAWQSGPRREIEAPQGMAAAEWARPMAERHGEAATA